jgi:hypothetical protein
MDSNMQCKGVSQYRDLGVGDFWFNELHTQPQSPSLSLGFSPDQHEHVNMLDEEEEEEEEEIPTPNQIEEEGDIVTPVNLALSNAKTRMIEDFVDKMFSDIGDEVIAEREEDEPHREPLAPGETIIAEEDVQMSEPMLQEVAPTPILEPPIEEPTHVPEPTAEEAQPPQHFGQRHDTLRYLYQALTPPASKLCNHLQSFRPTVDPFANDRELGDINNPQHIDVDVACFCMLSQDLPLLLGAIIRPDNRKVMIKNFEGFGNRLHIISDLVVVRVYAGETDLEREFTKVKILEALKISFGITLTRNSSSLILSKNQVNIFTIGMAKALYMTRTIICRLGFFGMKMPIGTVKPLIDYLVQRYLEFFAPDLEAQILHNKNIFDIGIVTPTKRIEFFGFRKDQRYAKNTAREECMRCVTNLNLVHYLLGQQIWCK